VLLVDQLAQSIYQRGHLIAVVGERASLQLSDLVTWFLMTYEHRRSVAAQSIELQPWAATG